MKSTEMDDNGHKNIKDIHHELIKTQLVPVFLLTLIGKFIYVLCHLCAIFVKNDVCSQS